MDASTARRSHERGFTLIELMIVVAIIAILAAVLIPNFVNARAQAQTSACESNLHSIATAMELYYADMQQYPATGSVPAALTGTNGVSYLTNTPRDPADPANGTYTVTPNSNNQGYIISCPGTHVVSTLGKLAKDPGPNANAGPVCGNGGGCADGKIGYRSGQGLVANPQAQ